MPKIAILQKDRSSVKLTRALLEELPAFKRLYKLDDNGDIKIHLEEFVDAQTNQPHSNLHTFDALVMRPKWGGELHDSHLKGLLQRPPNGGKICVATLSVSDSKITLVDENIRARVGKVIHAQFGNIDSTAELAIWMAITLRRRLQMYSMEMVHGHWRKGGRNIAGGLKGITWSILGAGNLASRVLARLPGLGVSKVKVWHHKASLESFVKLLSAANLPSIIEKSGPHCYTARVQGNPGFDKTGRTIQTLKEVEIVIDRDLTRVMENSDVVSSLLPKTGQRRGRKSTLGLITSHRLRHLKPKAILLNLGRAEVFHQSVYKRLYPKFRLGGERGFGTDVLEEALEDKKTYTVGEWETHRVWAAYATSMLNISLLSSKEVDSLCGELPIEKLANDRAKFDFHLLGEPLPNVFLSPHLGGATPESEAMIAEEVIAQLVERLGLGHKYRELAET